MEEKKQGVGDWLEKLQRESWNLELLVSGFSIFLLMQAYQGLVSAFQYINMHTQLSESVGGMVRTLLGILLLGSLVLTFNLIAHVFLRGFWIGAVGLRSVQEKIDLDKLGYSDFFTKKLKERVPSLDVMLTRLDTLASVVFSFTFLIVFMFFSLFLFFTTISLFTYVMNMAIASFSEESLLGDIIFIVTLVGVLAMIISGLIYAIDTITVGFFKKYNWMSKIFFPIYRFIGWITMASIYRSIYYSLASRFSKGKIRIGLFAYLILFIFMPFMKFDQYIFYPDNGHASKLNSSEYDDRRAGNKSFNGSIPSQIVKGSFLPLFVRYRVADNNALRKTCTVFAPKKKDGFNSGIYIRKNGININEPFVNEDNPEDALKCFGDFFTVKMDSTLIETDFYFYTYPDNGVKGVQTMIDIAELSRGKHEIFVQRKRITQDDELEDVLHSHIIFWKE